jgi:hypothetical protein
MEQKQEEAEKAIDSELQRIRDIIRLYSKAVEYYQKQHMQLTGQRLRV